MKPLLVAIALIFVPVQAWPGCAWVLWNNYYSTGIGSKDPSQGWGVIDAYTTAGECAQRRTGLIADIRRRASESRAMPGIRDVEITVTETQVTTLTFYQEPLASRTEINSFKCLPDTIDPREPKGGGR